MQIPPISKCKSVSSALSLLTGYYSNTFPRYSDLFPNKCSIYCILTDWANRVCFDFLLFSFFSAIILTSRWREYLHLKCFRDPMRNLFIFMCGPAVLLVV